MKDVDNEIGYWLNMFPYIYFKGQQPQRIYLVKKKDIDVIYNNHKEFFNCKDIKNMFQFDDIEHMKLLENGEVRINGILMMSSMNAVSTESVWESLNLRYPETFSDLIESLVDHQSIYENYANIIKKYQDFLLSTNCEVSDMMSLVHDYCVICPYVIRLSCSKESAIVSNIESNFLNSLCNASKRYVIIFINTEYGYSLLVIDKLCKQIITCGPRQGSCNETIIHFIDTALPLYFHYQHKIVEDINVTLDMYKTYIDHLSSKPYKHFVRTRNKVINRSLQVNHSNGSRDTLLKIINIIDEGNGIQLFKKNKVHEKYVIKLSENGNKLIKLIEMGQPIDLMGSVLGKTDPNYINSRGISPLSTAIRHNRTDVISLLEMYGSDLSEFQHEVSIVTNLSGSLKGSITDLSESLKECTPETWKSIILNYGNDLGKYSDKIQKDVKLMMGNVISKFNLKNFLMFACILGGIVILYFGVSYASSIDVDNIIFNMKSLYWNSSEYFTEYFGDIMDKIKSSFSMNYPDVKLTEYDLTKLKEYLSVPEDILMKNALKYKEFSNYLKNLDKMELSLGEMNSIDNLLREHGYYNHLDIS